MTATVTNLRSRRPFDWAGDTDLADREVTIALTASRAGVNVAMAWLDDPRAPQCVRDQGEAWRRQIRAQAARGVRR